MRPWPLWTELLLQLFETLLLMSCLVAEVLRSGCQATFMYVYVHWSPYAAYVHADPAAVFVLVSWAITVSKCTHERPHRDMLEHTGQQSVCDVDRSHKLQLCCDASEQHGCKKCQTRLALTD